ncbi:MAG TPA: hypothetical protein VGP68_05700 [Gemmataceae bacterium]|nr:hypothetical protein [Gemmataceae bacterium]
MSRNLLVTLGLFACAMAGCRGPQTCSDPVIVSSSPIASPACLAPAPACSSCAAGGTGAVVSPYGPPMTVGTSPIYGPPQ